MEQIKLDDRLTIATLPPHLEQLAASLKAGEDIKLSLAGLNSIDFASLQALASAVKTAKEAPGTLHIAEAPDWFVRDVTTTGLTDLADAMATNPVAEQGA